MRFSGVYDLFVLIDGLLKIPHWNDRDFRSEGFELSVRCSEDARLADSEREMQSNRRFQIAMARVIDPIVQRLREQCELWNVPAAPDMITRAVESDVPSAAAVGRIRSGNAAGLGSICGGASEQNSWQVVFPARGARSAGV